jgi:hypothetical protein
VHFVGLDQHGFAIHSTDREALLSDPNLRTGIAWINPEPDRYGF